MRVVHVIDSGGFYGAEVMLMHLCIAQQLLGIDVEVLSIGRHDDHEKPLEKKLREHSIPVKPWRMMALPDLRQSFKILSYCRATATNIIHSHGYKGNILLGVIPKMQRKLPILTTVHGYTQQAGLNKLAAYQWLDKKCLQRLDAVVLVSEGMRHQVNEQGIAERLHVIPNGIPSQVPGGAHEPIPFFSNGDYKIAAIGRLSQEKNFQLLINAMPQVLAEIPQTKLVIYGEGDERSNLEQLIRDLKLDDKIYLPGYIDEPSRVYRHADVFVNCSLTEGMPLSLLEALREPCPIVATDIPASRALLDQITGSVILAPISRDGIADAIIGMYRQCATREFESVALRSVFDKKYTSHIMATNYLQLYQTLSQH